MAFRADALIKEHSTGSDARASGKEYPSTIDKREAVAESDRRGMADHIIVGGGLAGGLTALALARAGRGSAVMLVEAAATLGGNHTWSFHDTDLDPDGRELVADLVTKRWPRQDVRFPGHARTLHSGYSAVSSEQFGRVLRGQLEAAGVGLVLGRRVAAVGTSMVRLEDETILRGGLIVDARGPETALGEGGAGFQKFVGLELELQDDGPWTVPLLMDATGPQIDGYRFTYVLPFSARRVLVEDTIYSENPLLDHAQCERGILSYAARNGARVARVLRREAGVLPLPIRARASSLPSPSSSRSRAEPLRVGYRGGFFHVVTGYSLPIAVRVALAVARSPTPDDARAAVASVARDLGPQQRFGRLLNRLMFDAMPAASRWTAFERFYRLPDETIARFYASRSTWRDRARVLVGRPPAGLSWSRILGPRSHPSRREPS